MMRNLWLVLAATVSAIYSAGLAHWDEELDLERRFAAAGPSHLNWSSYRAAVPVWRIRWSPFIADPPATLYVASTCPTCRGVRSFIEEHNPTGLILQDAESLPGGSIRRLRYISADGAAESGVVAFARALEHINVAWCFCGLLLRLPVIHQTAQLIMDVAGFGPRTVRPGCSTGTGHSSADRL